LDLTAFFETSNCSRSKHLRSRAARCIDDMAVKRSRATYEADLRKEQSPFAAFGTPLPPRDPDVRDDGSYVPVWKQEVRDERGLKRLHGAFTGGFSAGYYNTVGSKEGWTPSTFVSSRSNRKKDEPKPAQQRPEDFMDDEDIADAAEAQRVETAQGFSGIGSTQEDATRRGGLVDLFRTVGETKGIQLLKKMGWKEGQGVGPKVRRTARLDGVGKPSDGDTMHLFAPENTQMISFIRKNDHKGLGFDGETKLSEPLTSGKERSDDEDNDRTALIAPKPKKKVARGGIGIGILNDNGSDDEDPYEIGPRISYNRIIGGDKKKKKPAKLATNPDLKSKPVFISKKATLARAAYGRRKCHDGRLPLKGFHLSSSDEFSTVVQSSGKYEPPKIPENWTSSRVPTSSTLTLNYISSADAAKASKLDPKSRASLLGEAALPGKSVFDFLSPAARDRLASASGKSNLPQALGEIPEGYAMSDEQRQQELLSQVPKVDKATADAALGRGGGMPYSEDEAKRARYRKYLENQAGLVPNLPERGPRMSRDDWLNELREFASCAQIFKPMTGSMASRFTSASTGPQLSADAGNLNKDLLSKPVPKPEDPAEQAARLGMYGPMTRSSVDWLPTRLLCKRFNIQPPKNVQPGATEHTEEAPRKLASELIPRSAIDAIMMEGDVGVQFWETQGKNDPIVEPTVTREEPVMVNADHNEALEGQRAGDAVFKAIFGDDSDDED